MKSKITYLVFVGVLSIIVFQSCALHDVRTETLISEGITVENSDKGKVMLDRMWKAQGIDKWDQRKVYSFDSNSKWKGTFGRMAKYWPDLETNLEFRYEVGSYNGQLKFLDGKREGEIVGMYNSEYYEINNNKTEFKDKEHKSNKRASFALVAIQYFTEFISRIRTAEIISFAGRESFNEKDYDLVFCTWEKPEAHIEHDQYLLWINTATGLVDYVEFTVREPHIQPPGYKSIGGALELADYRNIEGVLVPHSLFLYALKKRADQDKFIHRLKMSNFQFEAFDTNDLKPSR